MEEQAQSHECRANGKVGTRGTCEEDLDRLRSVFARGGVKDRLKKRGEKMEVGAEGSRTNFALRYRETEDFRSSSCARILISSLVRATARDHSIPGVEIDRAVGANENRCCRGDKRWCCRSGQCVRLFQSNK